LHEEVAAAAHRGGDRLRHLELARARLATDTLDRAREQPR
jgi:hypothetical protein